MKKDIPLWYRHQGLKQKAFKISETFKLDFAKKQTKDWCLVLDDDGLHLRTPDEKTTIYLHFTEGKNAHRLQYNLSRQQPLSKAVGLDKTKDLHILDATAGFGGDAFVFASLGAKVSLVERHAALAALLNDALERAELNANIAKITQSMTLVHENSLSYLIRLMKEGKQPDVIYLDPMYPERKKTAQVKKNMQVAQQIVGEDHDSAQLLEQALACALKRVVVKRPKNADFLNAQPPSMQIRSKNTRYDIYVNKKIDE